jgi:GrpB-like predicted nucleotidyltransferase (UPF0157 family)
MIELVPYQPTWPEAFQREADRIRSHFGDQAVRIEHVGSTSVPGLAAKPVIDIQVSLASLTPREPWLAAMAALGYKHFQLGDFDRVYPFFARPASWPATHHLHLCAAGSVQEREHLAFRDWLREHPDVAQAYWRLKQELAQKHPGDTQTSREAYSLDKSDFVRDMLRRATAMGYPLPIETVARGSIDV